MNFSFRECHWWLDRDYDDCLHVIREGEIVKAVRIGGQTILFRLWADDTHILAEVLAGEPDAAAMDELAGYIRRWLDLDRDISPFYALLKKDRKLAYLAEAFQGLRLVGIVDLFEALAWSIIGQQINLRFAYTLKRRLVERYGSRLEYEGTTYYLFPEPKDLLTAAEEELRGMQLSRSKAAYLTGLAQAFHQGVLSEEILLALPDRESRLEALTRLKGIGIWTANYTLMKSLRDPSGIPHGDTGLLTALANHGIIKDRKELLKIERFFSRYKGWESYTVIYLWRSLYDKRME